MRRTRQPRWRRTRCGGGGPLHPAPKFKAIKSRSPSMVVPSGHDGRFNERRNSIIALSKEAAA